VARTGIADRFSAETRPVGCAPRHATARFVNAAARVGVGAVHSRTLVSVRVWRLPCRQRAIHPRGARQYSLGRGSALLDFGPPLDSMSTSDLIYMRRLQRRSGHRPRLRLERHGQLIPGTSSSVRTEFRLELDEIAERSGVVNLLLL